MCVYANLKWYVAQCCAKLDWVYHVLHVYLTLLYPWSMGSCEAATTLFKRIDQFQGHLARRMIRQLPFTLWLFNIYPWNMIYIYTYIYLWKHDHLMQMLDLTVKWRSDHPERTRFWRHAVVTQRWNSMEQLPNSWFPSSIGVECENPIHYYSLKSRG